MIVQINVEFNGRLKPEAFVDLVQGFLSELGLKGRVIAAEHKGCIPPTVSEKGVSEGSLQQAFFAVLGAEKPCNYELTGDGIPARRVYLMNHAYLDFLKARASEPS